MHSLIHAAVLLAAPAPLLVCALAMWGCGVADDVRLARTEHVIADEGGELALEDGAMLTIPPGALGEDADVTFSRETCSGIYASRSFTGCLYEVDSGTSEWTGRFLLAMPRRSRREEATVIQRVPDGMRPHIDTEAEGDLLRSSGSNSSVYASRSIADNPDDHRCTDVAFEPCGGEIEGEWELTRACGTSRQVIGVYWEGPNPYAACAEHEYLLDYPFTVSGSISLPEDGHFSTASSAEILEHEMVSITCLDAIGESCHSECEIHSGLCDCVWQQSIGDGGGGGTWTYGTAGTVLIGGSERRYCVQGNLLVFEFIDRESGSYLMLYERSGS